MLWFAAVLVMATTTRRHEHQSSSPPAATRRSPAPGNDTSTSTSTPVAGTDTTSAVTDTAIAAAVRYVASTGELVTRSPIGRREILARLVTGDALDTQLTSLNETAATLEHDRKVSTLALTWVEAPLTASVIEAIDRDRVRVAVWTVSVVATPTDTTAEQVWRTLEITVTRRAGRWLVATVTSRPGPTPTANPLSLPTPVTDFAAVARWRPVVTGEVL